ncbi:hypothetical protein BO99DRAFT_421456 [Aspergillus violaceofuscus CBS 115571]|uniref:DUF7820 domain-containing protein n=1 Tax=Aspergillus violaceofuscus (strain CBS 115571) TaxID=1450538 RepID=A0A2V5HDP8_ASPV1|nr:hypothetical protein BO99DRAFT_421456 [Aspergillus violaceofuscus CBS 115571]
MAAAQVQSLLRFLSQDAKVPLASAMGKVMELQKAALITPEQISKSELEVLQDIFKDDKLAKQVINAAKRVCKKRGSSAEDTPAPSKRVKGSSRTIESSNPFDTECALALPESSIPEEDLSNITLITNRAPLVLAFAVCVLRYTMPEQPISSRLSLAQAVVSANSRSKAVSLGIESEPSPEAEGWGEGQPVVKVLGREVKVLKRWDYDSREGRPPNEGTEPDANTPVVSDDVLGHVSQDESGRAPPLWGIDTEAMRKAQSSDQDVKVDKPLSIFTPDSARSYLHKAFTKASDEDVPSRRTAAKNASLLEVEKEECLAHLLHAIHIVCQSWASSLARDELDRLPQQQQSQQKTYNTIPIDADLTEDPFGDEARVSFDETPHRSSLPPKGVDFANRNSVASTTPSTTARSQSISSRFSIPVRAMSPYTGATGPSHPYAMYPQVGVSRSPSVATASTLRPGDQPLEDASGPQHPYAMYTQNVVPEEDLDSAMDNAILEPPTMMDNSMVPLGFPGHNQAYQRPPGRADDDVGDLIGPDGHTEQLPPYSRYPENAVPKVEGTFASVNDAGITSDETLHNERAGPPMSEVTSINVPLEEPNRMSARSNSQSEEPPLTGIMAFEEKLKRKGKQKACCGLPIWTIVLVGVVMLVGGCIGGVIGGVLGAKKAADQEHKQPSGPHIVTSTVTPKMDATPVTSTPINLLALPTGQYVIPASPKNQSKFCVAESDYRVTWSCMNSGDIPVAVGGTDSQHSITFEDTTYSSSLSYGAQAPVLSNPTQNLSMAYDLNDASFGPALHFWTTFDKLVVVPQDSFPTHASSKRSLSEDELLATMLVRKDVAKAGDKPWFCWWNSTIIEFFLYINETTKDAQYSATATSSSYVQATGVSDYPRRIKMEEKREYPGAPSPYCQQMQVLDDGSVGPISQETVQVKELQPTPTTTIQVTGSTQTYTAKAEYQSVCYCVSLTD